MLYNIFLSCRIQQKNANFTRKINKWLIMENDQTQSGLRVEDFRTQIDGKETSLCILTNKSGVEVTVTN